MGFQLRFRYTDHIVRGLMSIEAARAEPYASIFEQAAAHHLPDSPTK